MLPVGEKRIVAGRIERFKGRLQMAHPDYVLAPDEAAEMPLIEPVYGLTEGLPPKSLLQGGARGAGKSAGDARMAGRGLQEGARLARLHRGAGAPPMRRRAKPICRPRRPRGCGWPMTNCWPTSWRSC